MSRRRTDVVWVLCRRGCYGGPPGFYSRENPALRVDDIRQAYRFPTRATCVALKIALGLRAVRHVQPRAVPAVVLP